MSTRILEIDRELPGFDWGPWLATAILGAAAIFLGKGDILPSRHVRGLDGAFTFHVPTGWEVDEHEGEFVARPYAPGRHVPMVRVRELRVGSSEGFLDATSERLQGERERLGYGYRVLHRETREALGVHESRWIWYGMAVDPPVSAPGDGAIPTSIVGVDVVVEGADGRAWHVSASEPALSALAEAEILEIVQNIRFTGRSR